jgi:hypothetical protein
MNLYENKCSHEQWNDPRSFSFWKWQKILVKVKKRNNICGKKNRDIHMNRTTNSDTI